MAKTHSLNFKTHRCSIINFNHFISSHNDSKWIKQIVHIIQRQQIFQIFTNNICSLGTSQKKANATGTLTSSPANVNYHWAVRWFYTTRRWPAVPGRSPIEWGYSPAHATLHTKWMEKIYSLIQTVDKYLIDFLDLDWKENIQFKLQMCKERHNFWYAKW